LRADGVLFAGHSERGDVGHGFASAQIPMAFAFRHGAARVDKTPPPRRIPSAPRRFAPGLPPHPPCPHRQPTLEDVWHMVNTGRLEEAARL
jgi:chemotaxis protein methyltransferase WspC